MNHLKNQTSPYLLQHAENPVDWYPWCEEAFAAAKKEDKPIFLSIGYSTCHWCHVMAHESFEDEEIAKILNKDYISIKVDKEERPDIDNIYMTVCQAFTGNGGWPTTIFMTPDQRPFFAGTYFPKTGSFGQLGLKELLKIVVQKWHTNRGLLLQSAREVISALNNNGEKEERSVTDNNVDASKKTMEGKKDLIEAAILLYRQTYDQLYGGFGQAPKFPAPHNLLFLMRYYEKTGDGTVLEMVEKTLTQLCRGGIYDHIGGGFCRYSTDHRFLVPHFEKMLYDNALLILAYSKAYQLTDNPLYRKVASRTADYVLREMTSKEGGFYSAQDADSEGEEGKYYLFELWEVTKVLGEENGVQFAAQYDITKEGNFEGKNILNLLHTEKPDTRLEQYLTRLYAYRKARHSLLLDDKCLTSWNGLMIAAMCWLYRVTKESCHLDAAKASYSFLQKKLRKDDTLYVSYREGQCGGKGFLEDYANTAFASLALYEATLERTYLADAEKLCGKAISCFFDEKHGGFYLYGEDNEQLILRPKETYDGAIPSGNSIIAYNLVQLHRITGEARYEELSKRQLEYMSTQAAGYPAGHSVFLMALLDSLDMPDHITVVPESLPLSCELSCRIPLNTTICVLEGPTEAYPLKDNRTTFYVCKGRSCLPPVNELW